MEIFKDYEKKVIRLSVSNVFSSDELNSIFYDSELVSYEYTGCGYFLEISHPSLPKDKMVYSKPVIIGKADNITCGFIIFIENNRLTIECHSWGESDVTEDFREKDVQVKAAIIEEGKFVDLPHPL